MTNNIALFLDLDNIVIGAVEAKLTFDPSLILTKIEQSGKGRIVLRRAYGDWRQHQTLPRQLATAGFELQSVVRINNSDKNSADMQLVAEAVETLIDNFNFHTYVLVTGDRDFVPLVQVLRRRSKYVIGIGIRHTTSSSFANLCDEYIYYDDLVEEEIKMGEEHLRAWIEKAADVGFQSEDRIQASIFRQLVEDVSEGQYSDSQFGQMSFGKLLEKYTELITLEREGTVLYVVSPNYKPKTVPVVKVEDNLAEKYRVALKKRGLRVVPSQNRLTILQDIISYLQTHAVPEWQILVDCLTEQYAIVQESMSKSQINDVLRLARRAEVLEVPDKKNAPLSSLQVLLKVGGKDVFQQAVMLCDLVYLKELKALNEHPFELDQVAIALYDSAERVPYLNYLLANLE